MTAIPQFSLRWNNYLQHITFAFDSLRSQEDLVDVTLCCEGRKIRAHKMLLSACSTYFKDIFKENPCQHPVIVFKNVKYDDLIAIVEFMYQGEVNVQQESLPSFLNTAEMLSVQGLTDGNTIDNTSMDSIHGDQTTKILSKIDPDSIPLILTATSSNETTEITTLTTCESITIPASSPTNQPIQHQQLQQQQQQPQPIRQLSTQLLSQPIRQQSHQQQLQQQITSKHQLSPSPSPPLSESAHVQTFISQPTQQQQKQQQEHLEPSMKRQKRQSSYTEIEILDKSEVLQEQYETSSEHEYLKMEMPDYIEANSTKPDDLNSTEDKSEDQLRNTTQKDELVVPVMESSTFALNTSDIKCGLCTRLLTSAAALRRHTEAKHTRHTETYPCRKCEKTFKTKWSLSTHKSRYHRKIRRYEPPFTPTSSIVDDED